MWSRVEPDGVLETMRGDAIDIRILGALFVLAGLIDFAWIMAYPQYQLTVFGTTVDGWPGWVIKLQHPVIHLMIGAGFLAARRWALWLYLVYLAGACASEITTQALLGYHPVRTLMIVISLAFAAYVLVRRRAFR